MLEKSLEQIEQEKAQKYLKYKDIVSTGERIEQEKKEIRRNPEKAGRGRTA